MLDQRQQGANATPARVDRCLDRRDVQAPPLRRPLEGAAQGPVADSACQVDQRPRRAGAGDAVDSTGLLGPRRPHAVEADAVDPAAAFARSDDIDHRGSLVEKLEQGAGAAMGDHRTVPASEGCCLQASKVANAPMPNGVGAAENAMESTGVNGAVDTASTHARVMQLGARDHAMLGSPNAASPCPAAV